LAVRRESREAFDVRAHPAHERARRHAARRRRRHLAAAEAFAEGLVDMLCSDYHFPSLLACAVLLIASGTPPPAVSALLSLNPARHLGVDAELGSIEPGKRADLVAFHARDGYADVTQTWVDGVSQFAVRDAVGRTAFAL
jgi:imidazolonepropionase-like amidohydrolase